MALTKITKTGVSNDAVDSNKIEADSINATKIECNALALLAEQAGGMASDGTQRILEIALIKV